MERGLGPIVLSLLIGLSILSSPVRAEEVFEGVITTPGIGLGRFKGMGVYDMNCRPVGRGLTNCDGGIKTEEYGILNFNYTHNMGTAPCINRGDLLEVEVLNDTGKARVVRTDMRTLSREHEGGGVRVDVTLLNPEAIYTGEDLLFEVAMNTHTVNLDVYRMEDISFLRDERGRVFKAKAWESPKGGGHHRFGVLRFPGKDREGRPIVKEGDRYIEVVIRDVGGVAERVLRWDLPVQTI